MSTEAHIAELKQLSEALLALSRAGLPFSRDVVRAASSVTGQRAEALLQRVSDRHEKGDSLSDAIDAECPQLPRCYAAIVRAGERSGRMTTALESLADALASVERLRYTVWSAYAYPFGVAVFAWLIALWGISELWPQYTWLGVRRGDHDNAFETWRQVALCTTLFAPPLLLLGGWLFLRWRRDPFRTRGTLLRLGAFLPSVGEAIRREAAGVYCRILGALLANGVPLPEALPLVAEATGWVAYEEPSQTLAKHISDGGSINDAPEARDALPALAVPAITSGSGSDFIPRALLDAADHYRDRARLGLDTAARLAPVVSLTLLGGGAMIGYAAVMLGPYLATLWTISRWY